MKSVTRPSSAGRTRRDAVRGQVLETVERLLEAGERFTVLGVGRISEEAGVARSAFYTNFADKSDLLMALTGQATDELFTASAQWINTQLHLGPEALSPTLLGSLRIFREHSAVLAAYAEVAAYDPAVAHFWTGRIDELVTAMTERIVDGQHAGTFRAELDPRTTAEFVVWGAERSMSRHVTQTGPDADTEFAEGLARAVSAMLHR